MKNNTPILLSILLIFSISTVFGQSKFGKITEEELKMVSYPEDTTASAVILCKNGELKFVYNESVGFRFEYTQAVKMKILKTDGLGYADNEISYYVVDRNSAEEVSKLSGMTYNLENGKIVKTKMGKENIFDEDTGEKWKRIKFTLPAAKVGSVIEYKYTMTSSFLYQLRDFYFQTSIPTDYVSFEATIPEYFIYNLNQQGYITMDVATRKPVNVSYNIRYRDSNGRTQSGNHACNGDAYVFAKSKVPAAKNENKLWTINDYISKVAFELKSTNLPGNFHKSYSTTWENIDQDLLKNSAFGGNLKKEGWFKDDVTEGERTLEKASEIVNMIKGRVKWNDRFSVYSPKLKDALNKGVGSSSDLNFLLINALAAAGFETYPVLLSTRSKGRIPVTHPSATSFNYMITALRLDEKMYFIDAASKYSSWNILPEKCMVDQARIVSEYYKDWVDLSVVSKGTVLRHATVNFEDNMSVITVSESRIGNDAYNARSVYYSYDNQDKFIENIETRNNVTVDNLTFTGLEDNTQLLKMEYTEKKDLGEGLGAEFIYYIPPFSKIYKENPFKAETRTFPVNFDYIQNYIQMVDIHIPEGYEVVELPKSESLLLNDRDITFTYTAEEIDSVIKLSFRFQLRKLLFLPSDYDSLREFFAKMVLKNEEQIVFKKK